MSDKRHLRVDFAEAAVRELPGQFLGNLGFNFAEGGAHLVVLLLLLLNLTERGNGALRDLVRVLQIVLQLLGVTGVGVLAGLLWFHLLPVGVEGQLGVGAFELGHEGGGQGRFPFVGDGHGAIIRLLALVSMGGDHVHPVDSV